MSFPEDLTLVSQNLQELERVEYQLLEQFAQLIQFNTTSHALNESFDNTLTAALHDKKRHDTERLLKTLSLLRQEGGKLYQKHRAYIQQTMLDFKQLTKTLDMLLKKLDQLSTRDALTELYNVRHFQVVLAHELERARRNKHGCCLLIVDIDFFKNINDKYGHLMGDQILKSLALLLKDTFRKSDFIARIGGDEFVILLPETCKEKASIPANKLLKTLNQLNAIDGEAHKTPFTLSTGIACFPEDAESAADLREHADQALYEAKNRGRNQVAVYTKKT